MCLKTGHKDEIYYSFSFQFTTSCVYTEMLQYKYDSLLQLMKYFLKLLCVKAKTTVLQYKVLTKFYNLELYLVKSKINHQSEKYFESILNKFAKF